MTRNGASPIRGMCVAALMGTMLICSWPASAAAQDSTCTFRTCALRLENRFFGTAVFRGQSDHRVATIGLFPQHLDGFGSGSDSSMYYYNGYRRHYTVGSALAVTALVGAAVGSVLAFTADDGQIPILVGTSLFSVSVSFASHRLFSVGQRRLSRAVMWHNRGLLGAERR